MAKRRKRKKLLFGRFHNKFFKYLTIAGATLGVVSSSAFVAFMTIDAVRGDLITDEVREYTATFVSDGTIVQSQKLKRGEEIIAPMLPDHEIDGEYMYIPLGWDLTGNGIPEVFPQNPMRMYFSFTANAVYMKSGKFDLSKFDLSNMDLEQLMDLMEKLNIDWEQFMDMFNLDPEALMDLLSANKVLSFRADASPYVAYFRSSSLGDFNYASKQFRLPDVYDSELISAGSVNPLSYTANLLDDIFSLAPDKLDPNFDFVEYDIDFGAVQDFYPVPDCEISSSMDGEIVDSDAHYLKSPRDNSYITRAAYVPAIDDVISLMQTLSMFRTNPAVRKDERAYSKYAKSHYINIPKEYENVIDKLIEDHGWEKEDLSQVNNIAATVSSLGSLSMFQDGELTLNYKKNADPVLGLIENKTGTDFDFNATAVMVFRRLGIPARMVKGYIVPNIQQGYNEVTMLNQHYWCEIYVNGVGWMICECMNVTDILGTNPYGELDKESNPVKDDKILDHIEVTPPRKTQYNPGDNLVLTGMSVTAFFADGTSNNVPLADCSFNRKAPTALGEHDVVVSYTHKKITKTDSFKIEVGDFKIPVKDVVFHTEDARKRFYIGETFDYSKAYAVVTFEDNTTDIIYYEDIEADMSGVRMDKSGEYTVRLVTEFRNQDYETTYVINVYDEPVNIVTINKLPNKTEYYQREKFDDTGLEVYFTLQSGGEPFKADKEQYEILGVDSEIMETIGTHVVTIKHIRAFDEEERTATFEITVLENKMIGIKVENYINNYIIGDYFDPDQFKKNITLYARYEHTANVKLSADEAKKVELVTRPNLSSVGVTNCRVGYTDAEYGYFEEVLEITVSSVQSKSFALSSKVSTAGPGTDMEPVDIFRINTSHVGTLYFRSAIYSTYSFATGWSNVVSDNSSALVYDKAKQYFQEKQVQVEYLTNLDRALVPSYSNTHNQPSRTTSNIDSYYFTMFELNDNNYDRLASYLTYTSTMSSSYSTIRSEARNQTGRYLAKTASQEAQNAINMYINTKGYGTLSDLQKVLAVKNDLQSEFTYNISFSSYDASKDPIYSFLTTKEGICNDFASTAVMIYRHLGMPARYVTGFGVYSNGLTTTVSSNKAHAWVEVWLDNIGWVTVDPTGYDDGHTIDGSATGDYYGQGFGGKTNNGIYSVEKKRFSGTVNITYNMNSFTKEDDEYIAYYTGYSHAGDIIANAQCSTLPNFLYINVEMVPDGNPDDGTGIDEYTYKPEIKVYDSITGEDVTSEHDFTIGTGKDGVTYYVDPRPVTITVGPSGSTTYHVNDIINPQMTISKGSLVSGHYVTYTGTLQFTSVGTYSNYKDYITIFISDGIGNDVSKYYDITFVYNPMEIKP